jgi:hypothetical protein
VAEGNGVALGAGVELGATVGVELGAAVGVSVGEGLGAAVAVSVGDGQGEAVGVAVGLAVHVGDASGRLVATLDGLGSVALTTRVDAWAVGSSGVQLAVGAVEANNHCHRDISFGTTRLMMAKPATSETSTSQRTVGRNQLRITGSPPCATRSNQQREMEYATNGWQYTPSTAIPVRNIAQEK